LVIKQNNLTNNPKQHFSSRFRFDQFPSLSDYSKLAGRITCGYFRVNSVGKQLKKIKGIAPNLYRYFLLNHGVYSAACRAWGGGSARRL